MISLTYNQKTLCALNKSAIHMCHEPFKRFKIQIYFGGLQEVCKFQKVRLAKWKFVAQSLIPGTTITLDSLRIRGYESMV